MCLCAHHLLVTTVEYDRTESPIRLSLHSWGVQLHMNSIHQAAIVRQTPQNQTTICSKGNICSVSSGRWISALREKLKEPSPLIWLAVAKCSGPCESQESKSACHRQLSGIFRHPTETPSSEQNSNRQLWMENRAETEAAASQRGERTGKFILSCGDVMSPSVCLSPVICWLFTCVSVYSNHTHSHNRDIQLLRNAPW